MPYTDIWRCKHCNVLPDIQMIGRSFLIACESCDQRDTRVEADTLDQVVAKWNGLHDPAKPATGLVGKVQGWVQILKDYAEYQRDCFREKRERQARLKQSVLEITEAREKEDAGGEVELEYLEDEAHHHSQAT